MRASSFFSVGTTTLLLLIPLSITFAKAQEQAQIPFTGGPSHWYSYNEIEEPHVSRSSKDIYKLDWPVKKVAVIGAGVGGLIAYRELSKDGFDVHIFERDFKPGGNWHYTDEIPLDSPVPNSHVAIGDFEPSLPPNNATFPYIEQYKRGGEDRDVDVELLKRTHRSPQPVWYSLVSNAPSPIQQIREFPWPVGTEWVLPNAKIGRYLSAFASWHGVNTNDNNTDISYNTRVELVEKRLDSSTGRQIGWTLTTKELIDIGNGVVRATWNKENFDAVVVATGRYNAPNIPNVQGLEKWAKEFPKGYSHSRQYRRPQVFAGKTILMVGAATSGGEISREIIVHATQVYQSVRPSKNPEGVSPTIEDHIRRLPLNVTLIPEIKRFHTPKSTIQSTGIELVNGTVIYGVDHVIFATGYRYCYPFLPEYHRPDLGREKEASQNELQPIVTDGSHLRSLHLDVFHIDSPTLAFVNSNFGMQSFVYAEFTSLAISKVWAGQAHLPSRGTLWKMYRERVKNIGYGRQLQYLGVKRTDDNIRFFRGWLNAAALKYGGRQIDGLPFRDSEIFTVWVRAHYGDPLLIRNVTVPGAESVWDSAEKQMQQVHVEDIVFADNW